MRIFNVAVLVAAVAIFGSSGVAMAAPKDYCAELPTRSQSPTTSPRRATGSSTWPSRGRLAIRRMS
jgi:hypothetical protein